MTAPDDRLGRHYDVFGGGIVQIAALDPEHDRITLRQADGQLVEIYEQTWHALINARAVADAKLGGV